VVNDVLDHGITSVSNLPNQILSTQTVIDRINAQATAASAAVAHPSGLVASDDPNKWPVTNHRGIELMSGLLSTFTDNYASPMVKWRQDIARLLNTTMSQQYFPSARTGTDIHNSWEPINFVT
jgi:hypothetical protein